MNQQELRQLVADVQQQQMELDSVEVKAGTDGTPKVYDSLSAFSNRSGGGVILFGLDEDQAYRITGVGDVQKLQEDISSCCRSDMEPALQPEFTIDEIDGQPVVAIEVPEIPPEQKPCYYKPKGLRGNGGAYIRSANTDRSMTDYEIFGFISSRGQPTDDEDVIVDATLDDLDARSIDEYLEELRRNRPRLPFHKAPREEALTRLRIVQNMEGVLRPTVAGLLAFGRYPQEFLPQLLITFVQYYGTTTQEKAPGGERFLDNQKFEGRIIEMLDDAEAHIVSAMQKRSLIDGTQRRDILEYPREALREALANAVAHRDYSQYVRNDKIQIEMFADRLEIKSPGGLFGKVTEDNIEEEDSTRNARLMQILEDTRIVENRGSGIDAMIAALREANMAPPTFKDERTSFVVTFRNHTLMSQDTIQWLNQFSDHGINDQQRVALAYLRTNDRLTNSDYRRLNQVDAIAAGQELRGLVQAGLIEQHGARRTTFYRLAVSAETPVAAEPVTDEDRILAYVAEHGSITNSQCRELLGADEARAYYLLATKLTKSEKLKATGRGKQRVYRLP